MYKASDNLKCVVYDYYLLYWFWSGIIHTEQKINEQQYE